MAPLNSKAVANYLLDKAAAEGKSLTPMQLIKLVYIAHGWHLAVFGRPLIDECIEAWQYGPVVPDLYHSFKHFGRSPITGRAVMVTIDPATKKFSWSEPRPGNDSLFEREAKDLMDKVWGVYSRFDGPQLMKMTHQPGTPWDEVWNHRGGRERRHQDIPDDLIARHFTDSATANADRRGE